MQKIAFGGGCHWCTEAVFQYLKGVQKVEQGWVSASQEGAESFSEAVIVHFEEDIIPLHILVEVHLHTHNATANHSMREKYRSAIYVYHDRQKNETTAILAQKQALFEKPLVTKVYLFKAFKATEEKFQNYYKKQPDKPFCKTYIAPKLALLLKQYADYVL